MRRRGRVRRRVRRDRRRALAPGRAGRSRQAPRAALCGPNGNGIVVFPRRVAIWGDALSAREHGDVAIVSQSGNQAVNALSNRRGLRFHTVVSCGNQAVLEAADFLHHLADEGEVRSVALNLEADGDGARLRRAGGVRRRRHRGRGAESGSSEAGASAAAAHTGAVAGDQRVFSALLAEAGAVPVTDPHDLLEVAKTLALRRASYQARDLQADRAVTGGTTEGQTQGLAVADLLRWRLERGRGRGRSPRAQLPPFSAETERRLAELVPRPRRSPTRSTTRR